MKNKETLEEAVERCFEEMKSLNPKGGIREFIRLAVNFGAKWQQERMYSEEDMREAFENGVGSGKYQAEYGDNAKGSMNFEYFIEQFKKK